VIASSAVIPMNRTSRFPFSSTATVSTKTSGPIRMRFPRLHRAARLAEGIQFLRFQG
jgi:hypothetical protein